MIRIFTLFLLLGVLSFARDNPFSPVENIAKFTQVQKKDEHFKQANFNLPDSARVLKKIDIFYQNLNGSVSKKTVNIDKKVDWHDEFMLSYKSNKMQKNDFSTAIKVRKKTIVTKQDGIKTFSFKNFISFKVGYKRMKITTNDSKIRDFMIDNPYKIVVDFKRDANFLTKTFKVNMPPFISITLGNHNNYYRAAIKLDGQYIYNLKKEEGGFIVTLK